MIIELTEDERYVLLGMLSRHHSSLSELKNNFIKNMLYRADPEPLDALLDESISLTESLQAKLKESENE